MKRITTLTIALALAVAVTATPLAAAAGTAGVQEENDDEDRTGAELAPGEQLAGIVGVQEAELNGDVSERTYGIKLAKAETDEERADVVAEQVRGVEQRLENLERTHENVTDAYEAGEISHGEYSAEMAALAAERQTGERLANGTAATAGELDSELLAERGVDAEAIQTLSDRASELGGEEVSAIARSIAGDHVGQPVENGREPGAPIEPPTDRTGGPDEGPNGNETPTGENGPDAANGADEQDETEADERDTADADESDGSDTDDGTSDSSDETDDTTDGSDSQPDSQDGTDAGPQ